MSTPYPEQVASILRNRPAVQRAIVLAHLTTREASLIQEGRGSIRSIHLLTQALIDLGNLPAGVFPDLGSQVRQMMFDCGIGLDCAGYAQQAFLRATGQTRSAARFVAVENESLSSLEARGYARVADPTLLRPGDIAVLGPTGAGQVDHRAIVYEQHRATSAELEELHRRAGPAGERLVRSDRVRVITVDSSWGCRSAPLADPAMGGVRRETWWYNEETATWGWGPAGLVGSQPLSVSALPYGHPVTGAFGFFRTAGTS
jgi:hypothetical protein